MGNASLKFFKSNTNGTNNTESSTDIEEPVTVAEDDDDDEEELGRLIMGIQKGKAMTVISDIHTILYISNNYYISY